MRPLWRWWLFCFAVWAFSPRRPWTGRLLSWTVLPEWCGMSCGRHEDCAKAWEWNPEEREMCLAWRPDDEEVPF